MSRAWFRSILPTKLVYKVRALFALVALLGAFFLAFTLVDACDMYQNWRESRAESLNNSVDEWLFSYRQELQFSHLALKPRKSLIAGLIEDDNYRAIQVLLDEVRELHALDHVFLDIESETLINHVGKVQGKLKPQTLELLSEVSRVPDLMLFDNKQMFILSGDFEQNGLAVALRIPIYFDVGDLAANLTLIKQVRTGATEQEKHQWMNELSKIAFSPLARDGVGDLKDMVSALVLADSNLTAIPVSSKHSGAQLGFFYLSESVSDIRTTIIKTLFYSLLPLLLLAIVLWALYRFVQRNVVYPVGQMSEVAENYTAGATSHRISFMQHTQREDWTEVDSLGNSFNQLLDVLASKQQKLTNLNSTLEGEVEKRTQELTSANRALQDIARTDALTGVGNRYAFDELWLDLTDRFIAGEVTTAVVAIVDCDFFKAINDDYGHHIGDKVLIKVSRLIQKQVGDKVALVRLGGDEFAILFEDVEPEFVVSKMEALSDEVRALDTDSIGIKEPLSVSIGISCTSDHQDIKVFELMKQADTAMYVAKQSFSRKVVSYDAGLHATTEEGLSHENTIIVLNAIEKGEGLTLVYQPVYKTETGKVDYFEVLSRIEVDGSLMSPGIFLPVVSRTKKEVEFDRAVIQEVVVALQSGVIKPGIGLSINLSAEALVTKGVCEWFKPLVPFLDKHKIIVEITETTLIKQLEEVSVYINQFREAGFKVALDDFGSGYSSISYLASLPVDIIKLDMSLAKVVCRNERSAKLIVGLVEELSEIGYQIVIEGVEEQSMFDTLSNTSASHLQGYYINRPAQQPSDNVSHVCKSF